MWLRCCSGSSSPHRNYIRYCLLLLHWRRVVYPNDGLGGCRWLWCRQRWQPLVFPKIRLRFARVYLRESAKQMFTGASSIRTSFIGTSVPRIKDTSRTTWYMFGRRCGFSINIEAMMVTIREVWRYSIRTYLSTSLFYQKMLDILGI
jgi:hypothetical protein